MTAATKLRAVAPVAAAGTTVYVEEDFTLTTTGALITDNLTVDELGNGWTTDTTVFVYQSANTGIMCNNAGERTALVQTDGREDVQVTVRIVLNHGGIDDRWQGIQVRGTAASRSGGLSVAFNGSTIDPNLILTDGQINGTLLKTWDLSALLTTQPVDGDTVDLVVRCSGDDITFYSIDVNDGGVETPDDTYTLTGTPATNHGAGSGADWYGVQDRERAAVGTSERYESFKVESIP